MYYSSRMAMGKRTRARQPSMWVTTTDLPTAASHPFDTRLNQLLHQHGFDDFSMASTAGSSNSGVSPKPSVSSSTPRPSAGRACRRGFISGCC